MTALKITLEIVKRIVRARLADLASPRSIAACNLVGTATVGNLEWYHRTTDCYI